MDTDSYTIAVVIPCYKTLSKTLEVIKGICSEVSRIYVVDDFCPLGTGKFILENNTDPRVEVLFNPVNKGVGGAVLSGYKKALEDGMDYIVKIDGDGQMDTGLIMNFVSPLINGLGDYSKGNRFYRLDRISSMPKVRIFGNVMLSFMCKLSSGYYDIFDPTNGYTCISSRVLRELPMNKISHRFFFESDMLFRLGLARAVVVDVPMDAKYEDESSNLVIKKIAFEFAVKHLRNFLKRITYNYFLRDFSIASVYLVAGGITFVAGSFLGIHNWLDAITYKYTSPTGKVVLPAMLLIISFFLMISFLNYDIGMIPKRSMYLLRTPPPPRKTKQS